MSIAKQCHRKEYRDLKDQWWGVPEVFERQDVLEVRTDRLHFNLMFSIVYRNDIESMLTVDEQTVRRHYLLQRHLP